VNWQDAPPIAVVSRRRRWPSLANRSIAVLRRAALPTPTW